MSKKFADFYQQDRNAYLTNGDDYISRYILVSQDSLRELGETRRRGTTIYSEELAQGFHIRCTTKTANRYRTDGLLYAGDMADMYNSKFCTLDIKSLGRKYFDTADRFKAAGVRFKVQVRSGGVIVFDYSSLTSGEQELFQHIRTAMLEANTARCKLSNWCRAQEAQGLGAPMLEVVGYTSRSRTKPETLHFLPLAGVPFDDLDGICRIFKTYRPDMLTLRRCREYSSSREAPKYVYVDPEPIALQEGGTNDR